MPISGSAPNAAFSRAINAFTGADAWEQLDASGRKILSVDQDTESNDQATAINACLFKNGSNFAADMDINGQKFTDVGNAAARTQFAAAGQVQDSSFQWAGTSSGTDTITASVTPAITAYAAGQVFRFIAGGTNTGAATLNLNTVGAADIKKGADGTTALAAGDITAGGVYAVVYNGTTEDFELINPKFPAGLGTADTPQFAAINIGNASDTTLSRASAGDLQIETNIIYRAGGTDVPVADGGTGRSSHTAYAVLCGGTTTTAAQQSIAGVGTAGQLLTSNGAGALPTFQTRLGWQLIENSSVSNASEAIVDIGGYDLVQIWVSVRPNTDSQVINIRMSQDGGSTFLSGADDYSWFTRWGGDYLSDTSDSEIEIGGDGSGIDNVIASELIFYLRKPNGTGNRKTLTIEGGLPDGTAAAFDTFHGQGRLEDNTNAVDALRFFAASGNITMEWHAIGMNLS